MLSNVVSDEALEYLQYFDTSEAEFEFPAGTHEIYHIVGVKQNLGFLLEHLKLILL